MSAKLYGLTNPQKSIWLTEKFYQATSINTICGYVYITNEVHFDVLKDAINEMVKTNEGMRIRIEEENNSCLQYVSDFNPFNIDLIYLSSKEEMESTALKMANTPFMKENENLFQFVLFRLPNNSGGFIVNVHHLIGDSWSLGLIAKAVTTIYSDLLSGTYQPQNAPSYLNYIEAENDYKNSDKYIKDKAYWDDVFSTIPEIASIPSAKKDSQKAVSCEGKRKKFEFAQNELNKIKAFCDKYKISIYNFFMAVYSLYVSRITNLDDFVIGTPILNRTNFEQKHTMGMFISVAPLRVTLNSEVSFVDFAKKIATDTMSVFRHQKYSYQAILGDIRKRDSSIPNLYNVILSYQITKTVEKNSNVPYSTDWVFNGYSSDELQIHLFDLNDEDSMTVAYDYKAELFSEQEISNLHNRISTIIKEIISNEAISLKDIEIVTPEEKHKILYDFNNTTVDYPRDKTIVDLFEEQVEKKPDNIAVVFENQKLTFRELNEKANQLARVLISNNVKIGDIVGIYLNKSLEVIVSMFAILKAGATFLPLDTDYPEDRLNYIINNSNPKVILSSKNINSNIKIQTILVDLTEKIYQEHDTTNLNVSITPEGLMYVMYTSGSTGNPKGVMVKHKNIIRLAGFPNFINFSENEVMVQTGTIVFDACIFEIFGSLLHGFKLHILKKENLLDIPYFTNFLEKEKVTILFLTTGLFNQLGLQNPSMFKNLKYLLTGGDVISKTSIQEIINSCPDVKIINCYGPTENGSYSTCYQVIGNEEIIPIGKPITNSTAYVVSSSGNLCPIGVAGELLVGGDGVAKGYLNNDDLTKEQFIDNPFGEGLIYKTGDLVKWLPDGNIAFIGRIDNQVKIRGFRIELSEIDRNILAPENNIKQALTIVHNINNNKILCAYIVSDKQIDIVNLKHTLEKYLPIYMIPTFITQLKEFPLNINGKVDMKAFPVPDVSSIKKEIVPARNELDKSIISNLSEILGITNISITDSFFDLGGDSLSAIAFTNILTQKLNVVVTVSDIFSHPTIKDLSDYISTLSEDGSKSTIKRVEKRDYYPASSAQKRIYYASGIDNNSVLYNIAGGIVVDKNLDINLLQQCFHALINRHEVLRTHFAIIENEIVQIIKDNIDFTLTKETATSDDLNNIYANFVKPFDLTKAPLFRAKVVELENHKMLLLLDMHHIISDGTSLSILLQELCDLYNGKSLPEKQVDYKDFSLWEKEQFKTEEFKKSKDFWVNQFKDEIPLLNMPTTFARPSVQSFEGCNYHTKLSKEVFEKVNEVSKNLGITPYMLMLSVYYILLSKYTSQDDIVVGTPIVGRELPELSNMLGMFVNTLALRNKVEHTSSFSTFANSIKEYCLSAFQNQAYPFDELVKELDIKRDTSRNPLVDVMFIYQNNGYPTINFKDTSAKYFTPDGNISKFDLSLEIMPIDNELSLRFEYCIKLFDEDFIKRLSSHYINILTTILENSDIKIVDIDMLSKEERHQILYAFNNTAVDYPRDKNIIDLWEDQVRKTPSNIAIVFEEQSMTYQNLEYKSNQLAHFLLEQNVEPGDVVPILLDKSIEMIVSILAILKVGAAFLPIDVQYPKERIEYMLRDSNAKILLTMDKFIHKASSNITALSIDSANILYDKQPITPIMQSCTPDSLAYIMYTSGSTGAPKGVMITHRNIVRLVKNNKFITFEKEERILQTGSIVFDACTFEIWSSLLNGFELYIIKKEELLDSSLLQTYLIKHKITILWLTAPLFNQLCEDNPHMFRTVRVLLTGGDVLSPKHINMVKSANPNLTVINGYGPTENTTFSCCFTIDRHYKNSIPIGKPISNSTAYVVSTQGQLQPIGAPGELWVGGDGVGKGYLNNADLTTEKFISNPYGDGMIYKTGDLVKWRKDGTIDFLGRIDNQVKIRGFRVELSEINLHISSFDAIKEAVTVVNKIKGEKAICAYYVANRNVSVAELKNYLKKFLPTYMLPTYFMQLKKLPINANGKINKNELPTDFAKSASHKEYIVKPRNEKEKQLLAIFKDILNDKEIGVTDDFFEFGGDSLTAMKLQVEAVGQGLSITYGDIFEFPTVEKLIAHISHKDNSDTTQSQEIDYSKYNSLLSNNVISEEIELAYTPITNVLLTGFTGFLGAHVLDSFLKQEAGTIYCLIRGKNNLSAEERLRSILHFYFENNYDKFIGNRIQLVEGDITLPYFGLSKSDYTNLGNSLTTVIHCAALVKHYGNYQDFKKINIDGAQKIVDLCEQFKLKLLHISTISVSGNNLAEGANIDNAFGKDILFDETNFYVGQNLKNPYIYSKFEAERIVLEAISRGVQACILRMGNLTSRFSEGKFQQNHFENAFVNRIKSFLQIGYMPDYMLKLYAEFTPIDYCGDAIIKIASHFDPSYNVFHLLNEKHVNLDQLYETMIQLGVNMELVDNKKFKEILNQLLQDTQKRSYLEGIINDLNTHKELVYESEVKIKSDFTKYYLEKIGFSWPVIDKRYLRNYFKYLADIGYFNINID